MPAAVSLHSVFRRAVRPAVAILAIIALSGLAFGHEVTVHDRQGEEPEGYVPPPIGNGNLSLPIDYQGGLSQPRRGKRPLLPPEIVWAGRRYGPPKDRLVSFGWFEQELSAGDQRYARPTRWQQTLDTDAGLVRCQCDYDDALRVESTVFVPLDQDLVVVHKRVFAQAGAPSRVRLQFKYQFSAPGQDNLPPRRVAIQEPQVGPSGIDIPYELDGHQACSGVISLIADGPVAPHVDRQTFRLAADMHLPPEKPAEITFCLLAADSLDGKDYAARLARAKTLVKDQGYAGLLAAHRQQWARYWAESYVRLPGQRMQKAYNTSLYHLRINTTRWSIPVGLFNTHWAGHYFGWDELFGFLALASSNHLDLSRRVPDFRHAILPVALKRTRHYRMGESYGARYVWQDLEDGVEATSPGFWQDHVFHMGNIAVSAWYQYLYTGDLEYLEAKSYPVIKECATFYQRHMVYAAPDGRLIIGLCTDLERLGSARLNPFLTSCSAIFSMEAAARAAQLLNVDAQHAAQWKTIATRLRASLPNDGEQYIPSNPPLDLAAMPVGDADRRGADNLPGWRNVLAQPGCREVSVAVLGGLFPYPLFDAENSLQKNAAYWYVGQGNIAGNMYPVGKSVCAWYGGWMACALTALGDRAKPAEILSRVADDAGHFDELFEINEPGVAVMHPWFSTGEGNYVHAVNQMLLHCRDEQIRIAPSVPEGWKDFAYKLPCFGNLLAEVTVEQGRIAQLTLTPGNVPSALKRTLIIPQRLVDTNAVNRTAVTSSSVHGADLHLDVQLQGPIAIIAK